MNKKITLFLLLCLVAAGCASLVGSWLRFGLVDDAYISMRYARNWAEGIGPFFNPDERVEGYTNFLWTFLLYVGACLGADPPQAAILLGFVCIGITVPATFFLAWNLCRNWAVAVLAVILLVTDAGWWAWSLSGLETPLLTLLFVSAFAIQLRKEGLLRDSIAVSLLAVGAALTRPEGGALFLYLLVAALVALVRAIRSSSTSKRDAGGVNVANLAILVGIFAAIYLSYLLWRKWTYGLWLPNSFYAKHGFGSAALLVRGAVYVWRVMVAHPLWLAIPLGVLAGGWRDSRFRHLFLFAVLFLVVVILSGGDHFTLGRFCVPLIPILSVLTAKALQGALGEISTLRSFAEALRCRRVLLPSIMLIGLLLGAMNASRTFSYRNGGQFHRSEVMWAEAWGWMGQIWRETVEPDTVVAVTTAGALAYTSSLPTIDILGINDHHISQRDMPVGSGVAGHEKGDATYVMRRRPQLVQIASILLPQQTPYPEARVEELFSYPAQWELAADPVFEASYEYVTTLTRFGYISYHRYRGRGRSD